MIDFLEREAGIPELIFFRYNPGFLRKGSKEIGGDPVDQKYGAMENQLFAGYEEMKARGVKRFGIHTMYLSNNLDASCIVENAEILFDFIVRISNKIGMPFESVNFGGGIGIPYRPGEKLVDLNFVSDGIQRAYLEKIVGNGLDPLNIYFENGRMITGPHGFLVSKVIHTKEIYRNYVGLDACMVDNPRPAMYGAHHHITVLGKEDQPHDHVYDVVGSLCENNDKFAIQRSLPKIDIGDTTLQHNDGAHTRAMGGNYNGKLRSPEVLVTMDGGYRLIRRRETYEDYIATIIRDGL